MEAAEKNQTAHPRATANPISALIFWWTFKIFGIGYKRDLQTEDLYEPLKDHKSVRLGDLLHKNWNLELEKTKLGKIKKPSLLTAVWRVFGWTYMAYGVLAFFTECIVKVAQPIFLGWLIRYFSEGGDVGHAYGYASGVIGCSALTLLLVHPFSIGVMHIGMQMRVAACSLVYRKALKLSHTALGQTTAGQAVNLLSNDVNRFDTAVIFVHYIWIGVVQILLVAYLMWLQMGISAMFGLLFIVFTIPLQALIAKAISSFRMKTAVKTDERVRLMNEIISGIQVIKMYAWEKPFEKLIALVRRQEIGHIRHLSYIRGVLLSIVMFTTRVTLYISVISYVLLGNDITAEKVFVMSSYYNILRTTMTMFFPQGIAQVAEILVSVGRIQNFLMLDEINLNENLSESNTEYGVELKGVGAQWVSEPTLSDITFRLNTGELMAVIGPVGSGKSSLMHLILRELPVKRGTFETSGRVSYAGQEPWLFAGSVKQNILFGQPWDAARYKQVVKVCALERDFQQFPYADRTIVGERGVSLSGGQRARVNLARAVYKEADIYLLDDPLSAVDAHVGRHLFDECIKGYLRHKAVILVTHQLQYLTDASKILILNNGRVEAQGTYTELRSSGLDFAKLLEEAGEGEEEEEEKLEGDQDEEKKDRKTSLEGIFKRITSMRKNSKEDPEKTPVRVAETRTEGAVSGEVYTKYLKAGGNWCTFINAFGLMVLAQAVGSGADYWVSYWTSLEESVLTLRVTLNSWLNTETCVYIYSALIGGLIVISLIRAVVFYAMCMRSSITLHDNMFYSISRATMSFFNNNPSGRILNRFSKDMGGIDELLPSTMIDALQIGLTLLGTFIVVAIVSYWLIIPTLLIAVLFYILRGVYLRTSRSVKRLEGITRSPVFTHLNASIQGLTTIRACNAQQALETQFDGHQDVHSSTWYLFISISRSFAFWLDLICLFYIAAVTFFFLAVDTGLSGADVGLAITQVLGITGIFQYGMRQSAELENQMTSVERVLEFSNLESEPPLEKSSDADKEWPSKGEIHFERVKMRYNKSDPDVLKEVSFTIAGGQKIGVVGRTGAGKSSLISALFRLSDVHSGQIVIDGVETSTVGLHQLRASISIIPQEPVLFSGTMRNNLDPFDQYPDNQLWDALAEVELKDAVSELNGGLGAHMSEGGSNFSVGQRQLVCLARAIIRNNRILMLDEATANVDLKTDSLIQQTIRRKFANCTVLTIAHRLNTVMDSDKVLVMDAGKVAEFAPPQELLADPRSSFYGLAEQTGAIAALNRGANSSKL